jgi:c(7)-type cytochrome triheme protein
MRGPVGLAIAIIAGALTVTAAAPTAAAPTAAAGPTGFDHRLHDRDLVVSGGQSLACAGCHAMRAGALVGRPDHAACFGRCHGPPPRRGAPPADRRAICLDCHAEAALAPEATTHPVRYPPYQIDPDFAVTVGHRRHRELGCATCHAEAATVPRTAGSAHRRCAGCHDGSGAANRGPAMTACTGCHIAQTGAAEPPAILHGEITTGGAFDHRRHAARSPSGARCTTCHAAVLETDDNRLPAPTATSCAAARCHDGAAAFGLTAACTRCHRDPDLPGFKVERPDARFSHAAHAPRIAAAQGALPCATCHPLTRSGELRVVGHAPCAACHAEDFGRRQPRICGACHNGTEPWRALVADRGPPEHTEFGATIDHRRHPTACTSCHALTTPVAQLRPPRGHRACTGTACHAVATGPAPRLDACEVCHRPGLADGRQTARLAAPWSVRAAFDHAAHAERTRDAPACTACHVDLEAPDVTTLATPPKPTCAPCHDGQAAFKLTGTTCKRCHQRAN